MSFLLYEAAQRLEKNSLVKLSRVIDWQKLGAKLGKLGRSGYGPQGYNPTQLLKALVLQAWHNLSDERLEEALRVRLDFMAITGFIDVPEHTTFCRFRNLLTQLKLWDGLLREVNRQIEEAGLKVKESQGACMDLSSYAKKNNRTAKKQMQYVSVYGSVPFVKEIISSNKSVNCSRIYGGYLSNYPALMKFRTLAPHRLTGQ